MLSTFRRSAIAKLPKRTRCDLGRFRALSSRSLSLPQFRTRTAPPKLDQCRHFHTTRSQQVIKKGLKGRLFLDWPPAQCPGCGAAGQQTAPDEPGFYTKEPPRRLLQKEKSERQLEEDEIFRRALESISGNKKVLEELNVVERDLEDLEDLEGIEIEEVEAPPEEQIFAERERELDEDEREQTLEDRLLLLEEEQLQNTSSQGLQRLAIEEEEEGLPGNDEQRWDVDEGETEVGREGKRLANLGVYDPLDDQVAYIPKFIPEEGTLPKRPPPPLCERCHRMLHHHTAQDLPESARPSIEKLANEMIAAGHKKNHIYHLIDAADFPLTLIPNLRSHLQELIPKHMARNLTISYLVTRADIIMPREIHVKPMESYFREVLREALPKDERNEMDKPNILTAMSMKLGWGVGQVKKTITNSARMGGVWIIGMANVGKSRFVGEVLPAGSFSTPTTQGSDMLANIVEKWSGEYMEGLEPPTPPTVCDIPGTTAAPIRIAFRNSKGKVAGEVIDMPGFDRPTFAPFVRPEHRLQMIAKDRAHGISEIVRNDQSMLIAGIILLSPGIKTKRGTENHISFKFNPFFDVPYHITNTQKAIELMSHPNPAASPWPAEKLWQLPPAEPDAEVSTIASIASSLKKQVAKKRTGQSSEILDEVEGYRPFSLPPNYESAGKFYLTSDVTLERNPKLKPEHYPTVPYRVFSDDIVIAGLGWVEISVQVRRGKYDSDGNDLEPVEYPWVEVFTPGGTRVARRPTALVDVRRERAEKQSGKYSLRNPKKGGRPRKSYKGGSEKRARKERAKYESGELN